MKMRFWNHRVKGVQKSHHLPLLRVPNPNSRDHATKPGLRVPNPNSRGYATKRGLRVPNPNSRDHTTKRGLRVPNPNSRGHATKRGLGVPNLTLTKKIWFLKDRKGGQNQKWLPQPGLFGGPKEGGSATSPLHSRGSPTPSTGKESEVAHRWAHRLQACIFSKIGNCFFAVRSCNFFIFAVNGYRKKLSHRVNLFLR